MWRAWGRVGAAPPAAGAPPPAPPAEMPYKVASFKAVMEWKARHGLNLSTGDLATSLIAVAAPILSANAIDLSKSMLGVH